MDDQPERHGHVRGLNGSGSGLVCGNDVEQLSVIGNLRTLYRGFAFAYEIVARRIQWDFLATVVEVFRYQLVIRAVVVAFEQLPPIGQFVSGRRTLYSISGLIFYSSAGRDRESSCG